MTLKSFVVNKKHPYPPNPNRQVQEQVGFMASEDGLFLNIFWNDIGQKEVDLLNGTGVMIESGVQWE